MSWRDLMGAPVATHTQKPQNTQNPPSAPSFGDIGNIGDAISHPAPSPSLSHNLPTSEGQLTPSQLPMVGARAREAPEWRRQLLFWPAPLWKRWNAEAVALIDSGADLQAAGHIAFERLKPKAPPSQLKFPPTVPAPGCRCSLCDQWPAHLPRWPVKGGCDCPLCAPQANGYRNQLEALQAVVPELFGGREVD